VIVNENQKVVANCAPRYIRASCKELFIVHQKVPYCPRALSLQVFSASKF